MPKAGTVFPHTEIMAFAGLPQYASARYHVWSPVWHCSQISRFVQVNFAAGIVNFISSAAAIAATVCRILLPPSKITRVLDGRTEIFNNLCTGIFWFASAAPITTAIYNQTGEKGISFLLILSCRIKIVSPFPRHWPHPAKQWLPGCGRQYVFWTAGLF